MWDNTEIIKLVTTETRTNYLVSEPNYQTKKVFTKSINRGHEEEAQIFMYPY